MTGLPNRFAALSLFEPWALKTETERNRRRLGSTQSDLVAFAEALLAEAADITAYLDRLSPEERQHEENELLLCLLFSLAEVAPAIESYRNPAVVDGYDSSRFRAQEDFKLRPTL